MGLSRMRSGGPAQYQYKYLRILRIWLSCRLFHQINLWMVGSTTLREHPALQGQSGPESRLAVIRLCIRLVAPAAILLPRRLRAKFLCVPGRIYQPRLVTPPTPPGLPYPYWCRQGWMRSVSRCTLYHYRVQSVRASKAMVSVLALRYQEALVVGPLSPKSPMILLHKYVQSFWR